ncbi:ubiquitin carboxyl-terminal hydrolase CYLD-like isoform X2 [Hemicordylus capensis]|uniref:ubiquitin carboxyl-terminal hydrolase CYLD-like isoform X2 n=1 Tax=Hemicordylus capensis TaxID=884348 RepID=UPI002303F06C|nr:ubiquitin carboxyl-terminal hydrolase CYLD-like isoform X2 [Hemicordylus capensis]
MQNPVIGALGNLYSRLKIDASKIIAISSSATSSRWCKGRSHKKDEFYIIRNLAEDNTEAFWEQDILQKMEGAMKGIQGHCNSCYLDTTLFSLFGFSSALDDILYSTEVHDTSAQQILRQQIVQPLRQYGYVGAENVMNLRRLLRCDSFITEEKDPEEFLNALLGEVLAVEPLLKIRSDNEVLGYNCYQVLAEKDNAIRVPTVQQLLGKSLLSYNLKFEEIPSCLILQMPRFGKRFKTFPSVYPSLELDLTDLVDQTSQVCCVCNGQATYGCSWCHLDPLLNPNHVKLLRKISKMHSQLNRLKYSHKELDTHSYSTKQQTLELFAVLCIESSHYVAFVRYGPSQKSWLCFDSMADMLEDEKRTSIPMVMACPQLGHYLAMAPEEFAAVDTKQMDMFSRRFFCDAYTFLYHQPKHSSYRHHFRS